MGFFSWQTSDTKRSMWSHYSAEAMKKENFPSSENPAYLLLPDSREYKIISYDGYGRVVIELSAPCLDTTLMGKAIENTEESPIPLFQITRKSGCMQYWVNVYVLLALQNNVSKDNGVLKDWGIRIDCNPEEIGFKVLPLIFTEKSGQKYTELERSKSCPYQGFFYLDKEEEE